MDHFSPTQLSMYIRCPAQYARRYIVGEKVPPGISMARGAGTHRAAETRNKRKAELDVETPRDELVDLAVSHYDAVLSGEVYLPDASRPKAVQIGEGRDETASVTGVWADEVAPRIRTPLWVERRVSIPTTLGIDLLGIIDLVHVDELGRPVIEDLKTSGKSASQCDADAASSAQLTWYSMAYQEVEGALPAGGVGLRSMLVRGRRPVAHWSPSARTAEDVDVLLRRIAVVIRAIRAEVFPPCDPGSWVCAPKWCGYFRTCPYVARKG